MCQSIVVTAQHHHACPVLRPTRSTLHRTDVRAWWCRSRPCMPCITYIHPILLHYRVWTVTPYAVEASWRWIDRRCIWSPRAYTKRTCKPHRYKRR